MCFFCCCFFSVFWEWEKISQIFEKKQLSIVVEKSSTTPRDDSDKEDVQQQELQSTFTTD